MSKLEPDEITKLLDVLVGGIVPIGESNYDQKAHENLQTLIYVMNYCFGRVFCARDCIHRTEYSVKRVGITAQRAMQEWEEWLRTGEDDGRPD